MRREALVSLLALALAGCAPVAPTALPEETGTPNPYLTQDPWTDGHGLTEAPRTPVAPPRASQEAPAPVRALLRSLEALERTPAGPAPEYDRDEYGGSSWRDLDRDCQNTRTEVIVATWASIEMRPGNCSVESGAFTDPYLGTRQNVIDASAQVQADHVVSLSDANRSGAHSWLDSRKVYFANDPRNVKVTISQVNQRKSDLGPAEWWTRFRMPATENARCNYATTYVAIKAEYRLTIADSDRERLAAMLGDCK